MYLLLLKIQLYTIHAYIITLVEHLLSKIRNITLVELELDGHQQNQLMLHVLELSNGLHLQPLLIQLENFRLRPFQT